MELGRQVNPIQNMQCYVVEPNCLADFFTLYRVVHGSTSELKEGRGDQSGLEGDQSDIKVD